MRFMALLAVVLVGLVAGLVSHTDEGVSAEGDAIAWSTDLAAARIEAETTGRPLMVVFR